MNHQNVMNIVIAHEVQPKPFFYVLKGEPISVSKVKTSSTQRIWDTQKTDKFSWSMQLNNQHEGRDLFTGPIHMDLYFYMTAPNYPVAKKKGDVPGKYHYYLPRLSNFIRFVEEAGIGVLWGDPCVIASFIVYKKYDYEPRTEFTITRLKR